ncbi:MAG: aminotransferase class I/II-fold pyridoxal phosphate-dependent enzyme, partial [Proteobacteria bacterium]
MKFTDIPFNLPPSLGSEAHYVNEAMSNRKLSGDGPFNKRCVEVIRKKLGAPYASLTPSCTAALEMAYMLLDLGPGDEVILVAPYWASYSTMVELADGTPKEVICDHTVDFKLTPE